MNQKSPTSFLNNIADYDNIDDVYPTFSPERGVFLDMEEDYNIPRQFDLSSTTKRIKKLQNPKRTYQNTSNQLRSELIDAVKNGGEKIKNVARRLGINYSSAKAICQIYKKEGRVNKIMLKRKIVKEEFTPLTSISDAQQEISSRPSDKESEGIQNSSNSLESKNIPQNIGQIGIHSVLTSQAIPQNTPYQINSIFNIQPDYPSSKYIVYLLPSGTVMQPPVSQFISNPPISNCLLNPTQFFQVQPPNLPFSQNFQYIYPVQSTYDGQSYRKDVNINNAHFSHNGSNKSNNSNNLSLTNLSNQNILHTSQPQPPYTNNPIFQSGNEINYQDNAQFISPTIFVMQSSSNNLPYHTNAS